MNQDIYMELIEKARPQVTAGLPSANAGLVAHEFAELLREVLLAIYQAPAEYNDAIARGSGAELIQRMAVLPPDAREQAIHHELLAQVIRRLDASAFHLALEWLGANPDRPALRSQAEAVQAELERVQADLAQDPGFAEQRTRQLSEIILELDHILGKTEMISLRIGRRLSAIRKS